jgi:hypothetical protein
MTRQLVTFMFVGVMASALLWSSGASAQPAPKGGPQAQQVPVLPSDARGATLVEGKVILVERAPDATTVLRLDNGSQLVVRGTREDLRPGDDVRAAYVETAGEKVVKSIRVIEPQAR